MKFQVLGLGFGDIFLPVVLFDSVLPTLRSFDILVLLMFAWPRHKSVNFVSWAISPGASL